MKNSVNFLKKHGEQTADGTYPSKAIISIRDILDGTSFHKAFDYVLLEGNQKEFESSKKQLIEINQKFFEKIF